MVLCIFNMDAESAVDALQWLDWFVSTTYLQRKEEMGFVCLGSDVNWQASRTHNSRVRVILESLSQQNF
jgi:hypothetical protein